MRTSSAPPDGTFFATARCSAAFAALLVALALAAPSSTQAQAGVYVPAGGSTNGAYVPPGSTGTTAAGTYVPPPEGPRIRRFPNIAMVGAGAGMWAGGWLVTWIATSIWYSQTTSCTSAGGWDWSYSCTHVGGPGGDGLGWSLLPVFGPWLMLTDRYLDTPGEVVFPVISGIVQGVGLIVFILGFILQDEIVVGSEPVARRAGDWQLGLDASSTGFSGSLDLTF